MVVCDVVLMGASSSRVLPPLSAPTREALEQLPDGVRHDLLAAYDAKVAAGTAAMTATALQSMQREQLSSLKQLETFRKPDHLEHS